MHSVSLAVLRNLHLLGILTISLRILGFEHDLPQLRERNMVIEASDDGGSDDLDSSL